MEKEVTSSFSSQESEDWHATNQYCVHRPEVNEWGFFEAIEEEDEHISASNVKGVAMCIRLKRIYAYQ